MSAVRNALPAGVAGTPARISARLGAFTVDVVALAVVATAAGMLSGRWIFGALALVEAALFLWALEARTGLTAGNALFRLRTARDDRPFSPGAARAAVRLLVVGIGFLVAVVGAWVVVASAATDRAGLGRSWADRAARTLVVRVPARAPRPRPATVGRRARRGGAVPVTPPVATSAQLPPAMPAVLASVPLNSDAPHGAASLPATALDPVVALPPIPAPAAAPIAPLLAPAPPATPPLSAPLQPLSEPDDAPIPGVEIVEPAGDDGSGDALLLVIDTGQRERLPLPVAASIGRNPVAAEPGDALVAVADPEGSVSKTHLRLEHSRGRSWVTDLGSTNGTELIDDEGEAVRLEAGVRTELADGIRVRIGNRGLTVALLVADGGGA